MKQSVSHDLTDFQSNGEAIVETLKTNRQPVLLTENGEIQGVLLDLDTYLEMNALLEKQRLLGALQEGERAIENGNVHSAEEFVGALEAKYDL